jgi:hypothetical protein
MLGDSFLYYRLSKLGLKRACDKVASLKVLDIVEIKPLDHGFTVGVFVNLKNLVSDFAKEMVDLLRIETVSFTDFGCEPSSLSLATKIG